LLSEKSENMLWRDSERRLIWVMWLMTIVFSSCACAFASRPVVLDPCDTSAEPGKSESGESSTVETVCGLISEGKFSSAESLINESGGDEHPQSRFLSQLVEITREYKDIDERRRSSRETAYKEQLAELEKFRNGGDPNSVNDVADANNADPNDANDVNPYIRTMQTMYLRCSLLLCEFASLPMRSRKSCFLKTNS